MKYFVIALLALGLSQSSFAIGHSTKKLGEKRVNLDPEKIHCKAAQLKNLQMLNAGSSQSGSTAVIAK